MKSLDGRKPNELILEQPPAVEGALVAIDNHTGQIRAMVGGFSLRQQVQPRHTGPSSGRLAVLPFVFTAAIDRGFTPISTFIDEPVSYEAGPNQPPYQPLNYDRSTKDSSPCGERSNSRATFRR